MRAINAFATGGLQPDRTLLLRIDPALGRARQDGRGEAPDRLEREHDDFFARDRRRLRRAGRRRAASGSARSTRAPTRRRCSQQALAALEDLLAG